MATTSTSSYTTPETTATGILKRTVNDRVRNLFPGSAKLMALVSVGEVKKGELTKQKGMIGKRSSDHIKVEAFTYTPIAISMTSNAALSGTTQGVADSTGFRPHMLIVNTANNTVARIDSVTSSTEIEVTSVGSTAFACADGDVLLAMASAYEENSASPSEVQKDDDNVYNLLQIHRWPTSISESAMKTPNYGGDLWPRMQQKALIESNRRVENNLLFSERASSGNTTSGGAALSSAFRTTRGLWNWAQNSFDAQGGMTPDLFQGDMANAMDDSVNDTLKVIMFCGNAIAADTMTWIQDKVVHQVNDGTLKKYGVKSTTFRTNKFDVEMIKHDAFNQGAFSNSALLFVPDEIEYRFKNGRDLQIRKDIQANDRDGKQNEYFGEIGLMPMDGGYSILKVNNWK